MFRSSTRSTWKWARTLHSQARHVSRPMFTRIAATTLAVGATGYGYYTLSTPSVYCDAPPPTITTVPQPSPEMRKKMTEFVKGLQNRIVNAIEAVEGTDGGRFLRDAWQRKEGGEGISCVLQDGKVFEKAGVNVSVVHGPLPQAMEKQMRARKKEDLGEGPFQMFAAGISLVMHPHNPNAPTVHLNYRYFELRDSNGKVIQSGLQQGDGVLSRLWNSLTGSSSTATLPKAWWFGGGCDLTPSYLYPEDATHFHNVIKKACDKHDPSYYSSFKKWCDEYFYLPHRNERRGIGGIFFDDLEHKDADVLFEFVQDCGNSFLEQYVPIVEKRKDMPFTPEMKKWQQLRRGRYVEFNLVYDRGTKFGLATPGGKSCTMNSCLARIESILMSLPLTSRWEYMHKPESGSPEEEIIKVLEQPREWATL